MGYSQHLYVLTDEFDIRESVAILVGVSRSAKTRDLAYDFVKLNWDALVAKLLPTDIGAYIPTLAARATPCRPRSG